jgi:hypothetical protein
MPTTVAQRFRHMIQTSAAIAVLPRPAAAAQPPPTDADTIKWLYDVLTILDSKAGALLAFDGLLLAAASLMYEKIAEGSLALKTISLIMIGVGLLAAALCLYVARVSYSFLGEIDVNIDDNTREIESLSQAVEVRTRILTWAWRASVAAVVLFLVVAIMKLEGPI